MLLASGGCGRNGGTPPINPADKQQVTITLYFADQQAQHVIPEDRVVKQGTESTAELVVQELMAVRLIHICTGRSRQVCSCCLWRLTKE